MPYMFPVYVPKQTAIAAIPPSHRTSAGQRVPVVAPFTKRLLCQLGYSGGRLRAWSLIRPQPRKSPADLRTLLLPDSTGECPAQCQIVRPALAGIAHRVSLEPAQIGVGGLGGLDADAAVDDVGAVGAGDDGA